jgi:hypothetical protein
MPALTNTEMLACKVMLAAAHHNVALDEMRRAMRRERIPEQTWQPLWEVMGLMMLIEGDGSDPRVTFTENVVAFIPPPKRAPAHRFIGTASEGNAA